MIESNVSPAPPFKDRKVWLVVFGVATVLAGLVCALMVPLTLLGSAMAAKSANPPPAVPNIVPVMVLYLGLAIILVWLGIGSIMARRWARALLVVWSWSWLIVGVLSVAGLALFIPQMMEALKAAQPQGQSPLTDAQRTAIMFIPLVFVIFCFICLPLISGLFFSGKNVKATCEAYDSVRRWTDRCPLPMLAMVIWLAFGAATMLLMPAFHSVAPFFGVILSGAAGTVLYLVVAAVWAYGAWALYRLEWRGWWIIVGAMVLFCLSSVLTYSRHSLGDIYAAMGYSPEQLKSVQMFAGLGGRTMMWSNLLFMIPFLGYLLFIRRFLPDRRKESLPS